MSSQQPHGLDKHNAKLWHRAERARAKVKERRRSKVTPPADGTISTVAPKGHHGTIFQSKVRQPVSDSDVLMPGSNTGKIGGIVMNGRLKGAPIFTLALEERKTCPRSCILYRECYGNSSPNIIRWAHGRALENAIQNQLRRIFSKQGQILIRLHMLGDFYSKRYLQMWADLLDRYDGLNIFGFTAHGSDTSLGRGIKWLREQDPQRFAVRTSGETGPMGSWTIDWPTEKKFVRINGDSGLVCPEQRDANDTGKRGIHCGNCCACWQSDVPVVFIEHG